MTEVVMFSFQEEVRMTQQDYILAHVQAWDEVIAAGRLFADGPTREIRAMCYAYVTDEPAADEVVARLKGIPEIVHAFRPPPRSLIP
jgi:hypothetical protein